MHNGVKSRDLLKWSAVAIKVVALAAAVIPKVKRAWDDEAKRQPKPPPKVPTGQFGLLLLNEQGRVISTHQFAQSDVRVGYINKQAVQQAVVNAGADSAVMTYESPGLLIDRPNDYRCVIRGLLDALAEINVQLVNRDLIEQEPT